MKNVGNWSKIKQLMNRATAGESVTIGFIGGSITQGAAASDESLCYAARVYGWWKKSFPQSQVSYVNAGIGATTSQFGAARIVDDLLVHNPDFVIVEYSVNDNDEKPYNRADLFLETYEGVIRKICSHNSDCAILIVHSVRYDDGSSMEDYHVKIGRHYDIPCISMKEEIYDKVLAGRTDYAFDDITQDMLHPNDYGHSIVASVITDYMDKVRLSDEKCNSDNDVIPTPLTINSYECVKRYNNSNISPKCNGFVADCAEQMPPFGICIYDEDTSDVSEDVVLSSGVRDVFKHGWRANASGSDIVFELEGGEIALMYRKSVVKPAPVAYAILDGDEAGRIRLDANFDETWGDKAYMTTILHHGEDRIHTLRVVIDEADDCAADFYLISVLAK